MANEYQMFTWLLLRPLLLSVVTVAAIVAEINFASIE